MKNTLIILAHPNENSLNHHIASIIEKEKAKTASVELLDLYKNSYQQSFYKLESKSTREQIFFQEKITKANEIIFVFPYWWGSMPAILKNWLDWNLSSGFAFEYKKSRPIGLLKNKKVSVFTTTGAPKFYYMLTGANRRMKNMWKEQIVEFCGMKLESFNIFGGIDSKNLDIKDIENRVKNIVSK